MLSTLPMLAHQEGLAMSDFTMSDFKGTIIDKPAQYGRVNEDDYAREDAPPEHPGWKTLPLRRREAKVSRNSDCPCGSGKKYKKCCLVQRKPEPQQPLQNEY